MSDTETVVEAELVVGGMTCGACAARIERRLNRLDGVAATVNYATGRAYFSSLSAVPLTLTFRHAGTVTVEAAVTAPGTP